MSDQVPKEPSTITFLPTLYCSRRCVYCNVRTSPQPEDDAIPLERLERAFGELRELGVEVVRMSGGDPFARKDLFDVIEVAIEEDLVPDLPAKLGLSYYEVLRLQNLGVRSVQVDLDSADPTVADRMAGLKGYHARVFRVLDSLRRAGLSVRIRTVLTPLNAPTVGRLLDFLAALGNVESVRLTACERSRLCPREDLALSRSDREMVEAQVRDHAPLYPQMKVVLDLSKGPELPPAMADIAEEERRFVILPDGRVTVCEEHYDDPAFLIGDLRRQSVGEVWPAFAVQ
jgi:MoaA/NifB/PqqE/SkfB family radical SAM enzyme